MHIGINAHLISGEKSYRAAGIHGYLFNTLRYLPQVAPSTWQFTVMVSRIMAHHLSGLHIRRAYFDTSHPIKRIIWEQVLQPFQLGAFDLYHAGAFVSPLILSKPSVVTVYDLSFMHYPQALTAARRLYLRMFTALSCRRAKRVIAISHSTAQDLTASLDIPAEKIDIAPAGYDAERFYPQHPADIAAFKVKKGLPDRFWLYLGTLEPRKNLITLIDAYARLDKKLPLILAGGKGWLYDSIFERIQQYGLQDMIRLPGFIPAEELPFWYNSAELFVYPSVFEGFGLPVLEAMACGTPVVVSDASSLPEVAQGAGMLVPPHDVDAWVQALQTAYDDDAWRRHAAEQGITQAKQFTWLHTAQATIRSYQNAQWKN
ncbi:MAG: glycosyltransferase family 1 protein [Phototrophicales bacterium]|nr:MAG: glycosyltransferase family 1 protein [Phototrophicales bacterium]RMG69829.1 MAG: glycosyltransferase family 1 protein [Chloroflexota bacterium]